jgi:hypothetical protein
VVAAARALGDCLVVCINSDTSVRRLKGPDRPLVPQEDRQTVLSSLACVDAVVVFEVMLDIYYGGYKGSGTVDFQRAEALLCPYVQLEGLTAPLTVSG